MSDSLRPSAKLQENRAMTRKIKKGQRTGRDPETGTDVPNSLCRVIVFTPSVILKQRINGHGRRGGAGIAAMFWTDRDPFWSLFFSAVWFMTIVSYPDASRSPPGSADAIDLSPTEAKKPDRTAPRSWQLPLVTSEPVILNRMVGEPIKSKLIR